MTVFYHVGNADGMGNIRKEELYRACVILKVPLHQVKILDHHDMQDGFGQKWNLDLLAKIVEEEVSTHSIDSIITFDNYGISGHCNHRDVHHGIHKMLCETSQGNVEAWELVLLFLCLMFSFHPSYTSFYIGSKVNQFINW